MSANAALSCFQFEIIANGSSQNVFSVIAITIIFAGRAQTTINELQGSLRSNPAVPPERRRHRRSRSESPTQNYNGSSRSPSPRGSPPRGYRYVSRRKTHSVQLCDHYSNGKLQYIFCDRSTSPRRYRRYEESGSWAATQPPIEHSDYTYGAAVDRLRDLLNRHEPRPSLPKSVQFSSRVRILNSTHPKCSKI